MHLSQMLTNVDVAIFVEFVDNQFGKDSNYPWIVVG